MLEVLYLWMTARGDGYPVEGNLLDFGRCLEVQEQALILKFGDGGELVVAFYLYSLLFSGIYQTVDDAVRIL